MKTELNWMHHGVNLGASALVENTELRPVNIHEALIELKTGKEHMPEKAKLRIWCSCGEHFEFEKFDSEFVTFPKTGGIERLTFAAHCTTDELVRFSATTKEGGACRKIGNSAHRYIRHNITCIEFIRT